MSSVARAGKPKASGTKGQDGGKGGHRTSTSPMGPRAGESPLQSADTSDDGPKGSTLLLRPSVAMTQ
eukprot:48629-Eustigmatos_ZCMA.PRE.1